MSLLNVLSNIFEKSDVQQINRILGYIQNSCKSAICLSKLTFLSYDFNDVNRQINYSLVKWWDSYWYFLSFYKGFWYGWPQNIIKQAFSLWYKRCWSLVVYSYLSTRKQYVTHNGTSLQQDTSFVVNRKDQSWTHFIFLYALMTCVMLASLLRQNCLQMT